MEKYNNKHYTDVMTAVIEDEFDGIIDDEMINNKIDKIKKPGNYLWVDDIMEEFDAK